LKQTDSWTWLTAIHFRPLNLTSITRQ
jgi:hypothetical protein